jgi:protein-tyrosine phosphatase
VSDWLGPRSRDGGIDELPLPSGTGRLWLCGKHAVGPDAEAALERAGALGGTIVCLVQRHELADRYPNYVLWLDSHRSHRAIWFPIHDLSAPPTERVRPFLATVRGRLDAGEQLLMHCAAGIGRTGTMATALLLAYGVALDDALATVAAHRPMAGPEVGAQVELVKMLATEPSESA